MKRTLCRHLHRPAMILSAVAALALLPSLTLSHGNNGDDHEVVPLESSPVKLGAQLYDNWPKLVGKTPEGTHPLYPAEGKKQGKSSWRCKECHGWDYAGKDGRYARGSHYTGIIGVLTSSGRPAVELYGRLTDAGSGHDFSQYLEDDQLKALAVFLGEGLVDISMYLDRDGRAKGDAARGRKLYGSHCASCHDEDGEGLDFKPKKDGTQGVGWLAKENPQESFHKIRWGHPGTDMPSGVVDGRLSVDEAVDILTYSQSL